MKITRKGNLYQVTFFPLLFPVNCYLLEESEGLTLVDTALPFSCKGILRTAEQIGKSITKIVLTHAHEDHLGALDALKQHLPDVPVYISKRDARLMHGDFTLDVHEPNTPIKGGIPKNLKTRPEFLLEEGDRIGSLLAISVPGHTPGSMAFYDIRSEVLIAGDAFQTRGGFAIAGQIVPLFPFPKWGTWNHHEAIKSAYKVLEKKLSLLAVGHGKMIENPSPYIQDALDKASFTFSNNEEKRSS
jgi:glyoxylase-like metal-dependent hydrolase (beta-lactamase superfamily II)